VAAGKDGRLFLLQRLDSGGFKVLDKHYLSPCWCGPSYFTGPDGINRIVTSHGQYLHTWHVDLSPAPHLTSVTTAALPTSLQDGGFFTVVSSNGTTEGSHIVWAVGKPTDPDTTYVTVYAFSALASDVGGNYTYPLLFSAPAGTLPYTGGNANIVPVEANGKVYFASYQMLTIFGDTAASAAKTATSTAKTALRPRPIAPLASPHAVSGKLVAVSGHTLTLETRAGTSVKIDASQAIKTPKAAPPLKAGLPLTVLGSSLNAAGALEATTIMRAKGSSRGWPPDR
jgi:hypothetical protein